MWVWAIAIALATLWGAGWATVSWADRGGYGHHKRPDAASFVWHMLRATDQLGLSDEQQAQLRSIAFNFKKDSVKRSAEVELAEIDLHKLLHDEAARSDSGKIEAAVRKMYGLKADRRLASIKAFQDARAVLTPEQQKKLREMRTGRHGSSGSMDGHRSMERADGADDSRYAEVH
jgi:Spy/CpxP family protein refolding chaperone